MWKSDSIKDLQLHQHYHIVKKRSIFILLLQFNFVLSREVDNKVNRALIINNKTKLFLAIYFHHISLQPSQGQKLQFKSAFLLHRLLSSSTYFDVIRHTQYFFGRLDSKRMDPFIMGDGSLILPALVIKIISPPQGVSRVSRDQKSNVEYIYIGFMLNF